MKDEKQTSSNPLIRLTIQEKVIKQNLFTLSHPLVQDKSPDHELTKEEAETIARDMTQSRNQEVENALTQDKILLNDFLSIIRTASNSQTLKDLNREGWQFIIKRKDSPDTQVTILFSDVKIDEESPHKVQIPKLLDAGIAQSDINLLFNSLNQSSLQPFGAIFLVSYSVIGEKEPICIKTVINEKRVPNLHRPILITLENDRIKNLIITDNNMIDITHSNKIMPFTIQTNLAIEFDSSNPSYSGLMGTAQIKSQELSIEVKASPKHQSEPTLEDLDKVAKFLANLSVSSLESTDKDKDKKKFENILKKNSNFIKSETIIDKIINAIKNFIKYIFGSKNTELPITQPNLNQEPGATTQINESSIQISEPEISSKEAVTVQPSTIEQESVADKKVSEPSSQKSNPEIEKRAIIKPPEITNPRIDSPPLTPPITGELPTPQIGR